MLRNTYSRFLPAALTVVLVFVLPSYSNAAQHENPQLPPELHGAKIYHFPEKAQPGKPAENPVIYKSITYADINLERLLLNLFISVKPVDRAATIQKIYFQDVRVGGIPVHTGNFR